jgi:ketosteroid isomerase-like protein
MTTADKSVIDVDIALLAALFDAITDRDYDRQATYLADDLVLETPFAPPGAPSVVNSKLEYLDAMRASDQAFERKIMVLDDASKVDGDPTIVAEYHADAQTRFGTDFPQRYIGLFWIADQRVVRWREYYNPSVIQTAFARPKS